MIKAPIPLNEAARLQSLLDYQILDTPPEPEYDQLVELTAKICEAPISLVSLSDSDRQWFKASYGMQGVSEISREVSICSHVLNSVGPFVVPDVLEDERFFDNPLVTEGLNIRFYAAMPLTNEQGYALGNLCVFDQKPKQLTPEQTRALEILGHQVVQVMGQRLYALKQKSALQELERQHNTLNKMHHFNLRMLRLLGDEFEDPVSDLSALLKTVSEQEHLPTSLKQASQEHFLQLTEIHQSLDYLVHWQELQSKSQSPATSRLNLLTALEQAIQSKSVLATQTDHEFILRVCEEQYWVHAQSQGLTFVLKEILHNSLKFSSGQIIELNLSKDEAGISLSICDTGSGFGALQLQALQHNLAPVSTVGAHFEKGLGLGLMISKRYLQAWNAKLVIQNREPNGAEVRLVFPHHKG